MLFNQGRTVVIFFSAGIVYLFMIYSSGREQGTATLSLPPIKTRGSGHSAKRDFEENGDSRGILFSTDIYCNKMFDFMFDVLISLDVLFKILRQAI